MATMSSTGANFRENKLLQLLLGWYALYWIVTAIKPVDRSDWLLENLLTFLFIAALVATHRVFPFSDLSYLLITIFMTLHALGAHYTYQHVPLGYWMKDAFELSRNHFDRIVHFSFGLLMAYPMREVLVRAAGVRGFWSYFLPANITLAFSGLFELIEAWVAQIVSPKLGAAYLGIQGDVWDAQKDMTLGLAGAILSMVLTATPRILGNVSLK
jgi:putative membrane protein